MEQSKAVLAEEPQPAPIGPPFTTPAKAGWFAWFRPAFATPVMALLLVVVGYQNLVMFPRLRQALNSPRVLPFALLNIGTYGSAERVISTSAGEGFLLFVRISPDPIYSRYIAELYNPAGKLEWTLPIPASSTQDEYPVQVPAAAREAGNYIVALRGITTTGERKEVGRASFELQIH